MEPTDDTSMRIKVEINLEHVATIMFQGNPEELTMVTSRKLKMTQKLDTEYMTRSRKGKHLF
jgi:hypothetical protein